MSSSRPIARLARRLTWPLRAALGVAAIVLGFMLMTSPLDSLDALALYLAASFIVLGLGGVSRGDRNLFESTVDTAWIILGLLVFFAPGHLIDVLPNVIAIYLVAAGAMRLWRGLRGVSNKSPDERTSAVLLALTQVVLGIVAFAWTDLTLIVAAALFAVLLVIAGFALAGEALLHRDQSEDAPSKAAAPRRGLLRRWGRVLAAAVALVASVAVLSLSNRLDDAAPAIDAFYAAPSSVPEQPGALLRTSRSPPRCPKALGRGASCTPPLTRSATRPSQARSCWCQQAPRDQRRTPQAMRQGRSPSSRGPMAPPGTPDSALLRCSSNRSPQEHFQT